MSFLLDTHTWLWLLTDPGRIPAALLAQLRVADTLHLSAASTWEIGIKYAVGKLPLPERPSIFVPDRLTRSGVEALPIEPAHTLAAAELPGHHRDPFDRLLVAQSQHLGLPLVSCDPALQPYDVEIVWGD